MKFCKLVQACLHAPLVVADEAKLAIVFTYFFLLFFFFLYALCSSPTSGKLPCVKFFFFLSTSSAFHPLHQPLVPGVLLNGVSE